MPLKEVKLVERRSEVSMKGVQSRYIWLLLATYKT